MGNRELIIKTLKENSELKASEIAAKTGLDKKIVDKDIAKLKKEEIIISPKRYYWSVK
jgi:DNA-binding transcriptional ArsR family regulator